MDVAARQTVYCHLQNRSAKAVRPDVATILRHRVVPINEPPQFDIPVITSNKEAAAELHDREL